MEMPYSESEQNEEILRFLENERQQAMYENEIDMDMEIFVEEKQEDSNFWTLYEEHIRPFELIETNFEIENDVDVQIGWYSEDIDPINS